MGDEEGSAWIELHSDGSKLPREMERDVKKAAEAVEHDMDDAGDEWGKTASKSMGERLKEEAPGIARKLEEGLRRSKVTTKVRVEYDKDNNVIRRFEETVTTSLRNAFENASQPGGPISKIGMGVADAIGAGFNVSGRSPLIGVFALIIGAVADLIIGLVQLLNAAIAVLFIVPQLLTAIGLQAGVLFIAFQGVGEAIAGAFSAKTPKELEKALIGLEPAARNFVKELLPLKGIFDNIKVIVQQRFFMELAGAMTKLINAFKGNEFIAGLGNIAGALGNIFAQLLAFFSDDTFVSFIKETIKLTVEWLEGFGPSLVDWLTVLFSFFRKLEPFLQFFGEFFTQNFDDWARFFDDLSNNPGFAAWIESAEKGLQSIEDLLFSVTNFVITFLQSLDSAGGQEALQSIIDAVDQLTFFFASEAGQKGLEGIIHFAIFALQATVGLFEAIVFIFASLEAFFEWLGGTAIPAIGDFFDWIGGKILDAAHAIGKWFSDLGSSILGVITNAKNWFGELGTHIKNVFNNILGSLFQAGKNMIQSLIDGILSKLAPLRNAMGSIAQTVRNFWPFSPAKEGPLSGSGDPLKAGQNIVGRLGEGMHMEIPELRATSSAVANNITFGAGAIQQSFQGLPSQTQAAGIGRGVGAGIGDGLLGRDTRLAVRTL